MKRAVVLIGVLLAAIAFILRRKKAKKDDAPLDEATD